MTVIELIHAHPYLTGIVAVSTVFFVCAMISEMWDSWRKYG